MKQRPRCRTPLHVTLAPAVGVRKLFEREPDFFMVRSEHCLLDEQSALKQLQLSGAVVKGRVRLRQTAMG